MAETFICSQDFGWHRKKSNNKIKRTKNIFKMRQNGGRVYLFIFLKFGFLTCLPQKFVTAIRSNNNFYWDHWLIASCCLIRPEETSLPLPALLCFPVKLLYYSPHLFAPECYSSLFSYATYWQNM